MPKTRDLPELTAEDIRQARVRGGYTQERFAKWLGVAENSVWRWEAGTHRPVGERRRKIQRMIHRQGKG